MVLRVRINNHIITLPPGLTLKHALIRADLMPQVEKGRKVYDQWGNEVGLDGALTDGATFTIK
jgi:hypothetical protein